MGCIKLLTVYYRLHDLSVCRCWITHLFDHRLVIKHGNVHILTKM